MSWDVLLVKCRGKYESALDIPKDEEGEPLGSPDAVRKAVSAAFPSTDWSDPAWGRFESKHGSIEFHVREDDPVTSMMLFVRAEDAVVAGILQLCVLLSCQAYDTSEGEFIQALESPHQGLRNWREFLSQAVRWFKP